MFFYNSKLGNEQKKKCEGIREIKVVNVMQFQFPDND